MKYLLQIGDQWVSGGYTWPYGLSSSRDEARRLSQYELQNYLSWNFYEGRSTIPIRIIPCV